MSLDNKLEDYEEKGELAKVWDFIKANKVFTALIIICWGYVVYTLLTIGVVNVVPLFWITSSGDSK